MPSKHTHCYSNYVNHILNTSPSKVTYTFPKGQRFSPSNPQPKAPVDQVLERAFPSPKKAAQIPKEFHTTNKTLVNNFVQKDKQPLLRYPATAGHGNRKDQVSRSKSIGQNKEIFPFEKYLNTEIIRSPKANGKQFQRSKSTKAVKFVDRELKAPNPFQTKKSAQKKKKVWGKSDSPEKGEKKISFERIEKAENIKKQAQGLLEFPQGSNSAGANKYLKYSPYYRQYMRENGEEGSLSRQKDNKKKPKWKDHQKNNERTSKSREKQKRRHSRIKTSTLILQEMDHPSKNITLHGYYPLGVELNPQGKYVTSNFKNVPAHSFGKSPSKTDKNRKNSLTPQKNRLLMPNGAEMYPETSYYKNMTQKKSNKDLKTLQERYVPFSEFGNPSNFRY